MPNGHAEQMVKDEACRPLATKQKWYCPKCHAGYKTRWGVIIEMVVNRKAFNRPPAGEDEEDFGIAKGVRSREWIGLYCKADLPPQHFQDLKCMAIEKFNPWCTNPSQLMDSIPQLTPIAKKALQARKEEGAYDLAPEADEMMHSANWDELFSIHAQIVEEVGGPAASGSGAPP